MFERIHEIADIVPLIPNVGANISGYYCGPILQTMCQIREVHVVMGYRKSQRFGHIA